MAFEPKTGLSKSKYTNFCKCPKNLWLNTYRPDLAEISATAQKRFEIGNQVGDLAMKFFGDFVEVTTYVDNSPEKGLDYSAMIQKTKECLANNVQNICEASFSYEGCYCAVDILRKTDTGYEIYEVKSSSDKDDKKPKMLCYAQDIALQKYVLEHCGIHVVGTYLVRINHEYVLEGNLDIKRLFSIKDMSEYVASEYAHIEENIQKARQTLSSETEPQVPISKNCSSPYDCNFWGYCTGQMPKPSVLDLYDDHRGVRWQCIQQGRYEFSELRNERLNDVQRMIVDCTIENREHIDKHQLQEFISGLTYPLYFFDFESVQPTVPVFQNTRPYQQIPFQYSLHIQNEPGAAPTHKEFLAESGENPLRKIAESICRDIPRDACVVAYNMNFEKARLKELASMFPDLSEHLMNIHDHIKDLLEPFKKGFCYMPAMKNSFSIKSVLPALFPNDPELDYHNLDGVHNGVEASDIFLKIKDMSPEDAARTRQNLLDYCGLDTFALVKVLDKLWEISDKRV